VESQQIPGSNEEFNKVTFQQHRKPITA